MFAPEECNQLLGLAVESPLGWHWVDDFCPHLYEWASKKDSWPCRASIYCSEALFFACMGDHWPRAVTIESSLESGCGLRHRMTAMTLV